MMRFERKFLLSPSALNPLQAFLNLNLYNIAYPRRRITSIYYDTLNYDLFYDSENGISDRQKIRIRFYDNDCQNLFLEYN